MTREQKISHLKALYYLANADHIYSEIEARFIIAVARHLQIDLDELEDFSEKKPEIDIPEDEFTVYLLFHRLILLIMVDDEISNSEWTACKELGLDMGLPTEAITEIMDYVSSQGTEPRIARELLDIIRKHLR